jgi:hypothetical protein
VLHEPLDGAALARRVASLEDDDVPVPVGLAPLLQLQQFDLQQSLLLLVVLASQARVVRVVLAPGVDDVAAPMGQQFGVVIVVVTHGVGSGFVCDDHAANVSTAMNVAVTRR